MNLKGEKAKQVETNKKYIYILNVILFFLILKRKRKPFF